MTHQVLLYPLSLAMTQRIFGPVGNTKLLVHELTHIAQFEEFPELARDFCNEALKSIDLFDPGRPAHAKDNLGAMTPHTMKKILLEGHARWVENLFEKEHKKASSGLLSRAVWGCYDAFNHGMAFSLGAGILVLEAAGKAKIFCDATSMWLLLPKSALSLSFMASKVGRRASVKSSSPYPTPERHRA